MRYRRVKMAGTTYFFTVNLLDRKQNLLTAHINRLRCCFQKVKARHNFTLDAIVVLPANWAVGLDEINTGFGE